MRRQDSWWWRHGFTREWWKSLSPEQQATFLDTLSDEDLADWRHDWRIWARDKQLAPEGEWDVWFLKCGRGFGKTRTAVEFINEEIREGRGTRIAIVGQGLADIRKVMIEGVSGFIRTAKPGERPTFSPSVSGGILEWPNGAVGYVHSAEDPDSLRGPEYDLAWFDEPMAVPPQLREDTISNLDMGLRLGKDPRLVMTMTPKPHRWMHEQMEKAKDPRNGIVLTEGSTYENEENLAPKFIRKIRRKYEGTSIGRQEVYGEVLGEEEGAIWTPKILDAVRINVPMPADNMSEEAQREVQETAAKKIAASCDKVIVAVDPNTTKGKSSHAAGIIVLGKRGEKRFVLADRSVVGQSPAKWAQEVIRAAEDFRATEVVAEANQGGDLIKDVVVKAADDAHFDIKVVKVHAQKGKVRRAEPFGAAYERKTVQHVGPVGHRERPGPFWRLETQMCALHEEYDETGEDFDRADAVCWGLKRLGAGSSSGSGVSGGVGIATFDQMLGEAA